MDPMLAHEPHRRVRQGRRVRHLLLDSRWVMSGSNLTEYRHPYYTKQWAVLRREALTRDGYQCQRCRVILTNGRRSPRSAVVHHIKAHKGDMVLFYDLANLQAVCWQCHSGAIQSEEVKGYDSTIGQDGWPVSPNHPSVK
jgi:5-methylcytosine-specific restriction protein A